MTNAMDKAIVIRMPMETLRLTDSLTLAVLDSDAECASEKTVEIVGELEALWDIELERE
jgi:hypothetical protein